MGKGKYRSKKKSKILASGFNIERREGKYCSEKKIIKIGNLPPVRQILWVKESIAVKKFKIKKIGNLPPVRQIVWVKKIIAVKFKIKKIGICLRLGKLFG